MKKAYLTPVEVEMELNKGRETKDIGTEKEEARTVKQWVNQALKSSSYGDKTLICADPVYIHIPVWQRKLNIQNATDIGKHYNKYKWELPKILYWEGKLWCIDGMHRIYGSYLGGLEQVTMEIMTDITMKEAIKIFLDQTEDRKKMSLTDMWGAALEAEVEEYVVLHNICENNRVCVRDEEFNGENHVGTFTSVRDGLKMAKGNPELLNDILALITKLQWNGDVNVPGKAYGAIAFRVIRKLYGYYGEHKEQMESILMEKCSGASYWNSHLDKKTQGQMFDHLSDIIASNLDIVDITKYMEEKKETTKQNITYIGA